MTKDCELDATDYLFCWNVGSPAQLLPTKSLRINFNQKYRNFRKKMNSYETTQLLMKKQQHINRRDNRVHIGNTFFLMRNTSGKRVA